MSDILISVDHLYVNQTDSRSDMTALSTESTESNISRITASGASSLSSETAQNV